MSDQYILVVDDDAGVRYTLREILQESEMDVLEASNGQQALETLSNNRTDLIISDLAMPGMDGMEVLRRAYELQPQSYEELIAIRGMGPKKIRALALLSDLVWGTKASWSDPVKYTFSHGGKDGYPFPVDRQTYDNTIEQLESAILEAKCESKERLNALKRLHEL